MLFRSAGWSKAISQGVGTGHLLSSVSNEASKGAALAVKTEALKPDGEQQPVNGQKVMTDAVLNSLGFNPDYLMQGIDACAGETISIESSESIKPAVLRGSTNDGYLYLVMPQRLTS